MRACRPQQRLGMTLLELLIAMFVLSLMMTMVVTGIVSALRNGAKMSNQLEIVRQATTGLDRLERELQMCQQVYLPDPNGGQFAEPPGTNTYSPDAATGNQPFVFAHPTYPPVGPALNGMVVVGYQWDSQKQILQYLEYDPTTFDPASPQPLNGAQWQTMATNVTGFQISRLPRNPANWGGTSGIQNLEVQFTVTNNASVAIPFDVWVPIESLGPGF